MAISCPNSTLLNPPTATLGDCGYNVVTKLLGDAVSRPARRAKKPDRPASITIICWLIVIGSVISLLQFMAGARDPMVTELLEQGPIPISLL